MLDISLIKNIRQTCTEQLVLSEVKASRSKSNISTYRMFLIGLILLTIMTGCNGCGGKKELDKRLVAEYNGNSLYMYQLERYVPHELKGKDSIEFANNYIDDWLTSEAVKEKAKSEISNLDEIVEPEVSTLKMSLIRKAFADWLVNTQLEKNISEQELRDYFKKYPDRFRSDRVQYQYFYVKVMSENATQIASQISSSKPEELNKLVKWCEDNAIEYRLDSSVTSESELKRISTGYNGFITRAKPNTLQTYNVTEGGKNYTQFFRMIKVIQENEILPFAACKDRIEMLIINQRKNELIEQTEHGLLEEAKKSNKYKKHIE